MKDRQDRPNNNLYNETKGYKKCAGKNCNRIGNNPLKIVFIDRVGWFCDLCKEDLINLKLVGDIE